jgi:hypothetical protein
VINSLRYLEPAYRLRENFQYNNLMYAVAGILIEKVTGQTWEEALSSRIFIPLAMQNSNTSVEETQKNSDFSARYAESAGKIKSISFRDLHSIAPAVAINSSISDMLKWIQLQLSDGTLNGVNYICKERVQEMHTIHMPEASSPIEEEVFCFGYGLGWGVGMYKGNYYLSHNGSIDGSLSQVFLIPQKKIGVVILSNNACVDPAVVSSITNTIIDTLIGKTGVDWIDKVKKQRAQSSDELQEGHRDSQALDAAPTHELEDYVGSYAHPAYGVVDVKLENNALVASYGELLFSLQYKEGDLFIGEVSLDCFEGRISLGFEFSPNMWGDIFEVSIPLEQSVMPILFNKQ